MARDEKPAAAGTGAEAPSFEEAIERLQAIVEELEGGALSLEESIARYEEGVRLSRRLTQTLDEAEKRIERLTEDASGAPVTEPMELEGNGAEETGREPARPPAAVTPPEPPAPQPAPAAPAAPEPSARRAAEPAPRRDRSIDELPF